MNTNLPPAGDTCAQFRILTRVHLAAGGAEGCPVPYLVMMTTTSGAEVGPIGCSDINALRRLVDYVRPAEILLLHGDGETDPEIEKMIVMTPADPRKLN